MVHDSLSSNFPSAFSGIEAKDWTKHIESLFVLQAMWTRSRATSVFVFLGVSLNALRQIRVNDEKVGEINIALGQKLNPDTYNNVNLKGNETTINFLENKDRFVLGCKEIAKLEVIRVLGKGVQKVAFEVKLPWGEHAVAKRCKNYKCTRAGKIREEARLLRELQEQYGDEAVRYYGECNAAVVQTEEMVDHLSNFSVGYTSVVELGKPLLSSWKTKDRKCFAEFFTETDIEDIRNIARRYANFSNSPLLLAPIGYTTDNIFAQQYMTSLGGTREGKINHIDLDMVYSCKETQTRSRNPRQLDTNRGTCSIDEVLDVNCQVMAKLTNIPNLDCSLYPSTQNSAVDSPNHRINASHAASECIKRKSPPYSEEEKKPIFYWPASSCVGLDWQIHRGCPPPPENNIKQALDLKGRRKNHFINGINTS